MTTAARWLVMVAVGVHAGVAAQPGERFIYSSPGFDTLGRVIEVLSGKSFTDFMDARIFAPLGMNDTTFIVPPAKQPRIPTVYRIEDGALREGAAANFADNNPFDADRVFPAPAFGLYSTAHDLAALLQMLLNEGRHEGRSLLSEASIDLMTRTHLRGDDLPAWGLGWTVAREGGFVAAPLTSDLAYGHNGSTGVVVWIDPHYDLAGAFLVHQAGRQTRAAATGFVNMATAAVTSR